MRKKLLSLLLTLMPAVVMGGVGDKFYSPAAYTDADGNSLSVDMYFVVVSESPAEVYITAPINDDPFKTDVQANVLTIPSTVTNGSVTYTVTGIEDPVSGAEAGTFSYGNSSFKKIVLPKTLIHLKGVDPLNAPTAAFAVEDGNPAFWADDRGVLYNSDKSQIVRLPTRSTLYTLDVTTETSIAPYAFAHCTNLERANLGDQLTSLGEGAFYGSEYLTQATLPKGLTAIPDNLFFGCSSLATMEIPSTVTTIGDEVFRNCFTLQSVNFPDGLTSIGTESFRECRKLESVKFPNALQHIGSFAFYHDVLLTSLDIPSGCDIGYFAFSNCTGLKSVILRHGVKFYSSSSDDNHFSNCTSLNRIVSLSTEAPVIVGDGTFTTGTFKNCPSTLEFYVPLGAELDYKAKHWPGTIRPMVNITKATGKTFAYEENIDLGSTQVLDADFNTLEDNDLMAYQATAVTNQATSQMKVEGRLLNGIVPAQTGMILYGSQDRIYVLTPTTAAATADVKDNKLVGVLGSLSMDDKQGSRYFIYSGGMFYVSSGHSFSTRSGQSSVSSFPSGYSYASKYAYKCYLDCGEPVNAKSLTFTLDDTPTGITSARVDRDDNFYNLMGLKVARPVKGIYIHHGKKVIIK